MPLIGFLAVQLPVSCCRTVEVRFLFNLENTMEKHCHSTQSIGPRRRHVMYRPNYCIITTIH